MSAQKDTIYIDVDDEITAVIEKVQTADNKIVALVLPKRATMLQSIVNMKLLKRSAEDAGKSLVLITSEAGILPLAGAVGLHAAKNLQTKPAIPSAPDTGGANEPIEADDVVLDSSTPVGDLAGLPPEEGEETIEVGDDIAAELPDTTAGKTSKKFKIPNFSKFRLRLVLAACLIIGLIVFWVLGTRVWPSAKIVIRTDTTKVSADVTVNASPDIEVVDLEKSNIPAKLEKLRKTDTEEVKATGEKNEGKKADGHLTLTNCIDDGQEHTVPAGSQFSRSGKVFVTTEAVTLEPAYVPGGVCKSADLPPGFGTYKDVDAQAVNAGADYNISEGEYNSSIAGITAYGSDMKGGTDKIVKVLSQKDVDDALKKIADRNGPEASDQLKQTLQAQSFLPITDSLKEGKPTVGTTPDVNDETEEATVTVTVVYTMVGVDRPAMEEVIKNSVKDQIDLSKQAISNTGLDEAVIRLVEQKSGGRLKLEIQTLVTAGPEINEATIKQEIVGKKRGETQNILQNRPGIKEVTVDYSPFWVYSTPKNPHKISIVIESVNSEGNATPDASAN